jgi:hypothetical protein
MYQTLLTDPTKHTRKIFFLYTAMLHMFTHKKQRVQKTNDILPNEYRSEQASSNIHIASSCGVFFRVKS